MWWTQLLTKPFFGHACRYSPNSEFGEIGNVLPLCLWISWDSTGMHVNRIHHLEEVEGKLLLENNMLHSTIFMISHSLPLHSIISNDIPMIFQWYSNDIPMIFQWYSNDIPMIFQWYSNDIPWYPIHSDYAQGYLITSPGGKEQITHLCLEALPSLADRQNHKARLAKGLRHVGGGF